MQWPNMSVQQTAQMIVTWTVRLSTCKNPVEINNQSLFQYGFHKGLIPDSSTALRGNMKLLSPLSSKHCWHAPHDTFEPCRALLECPSLSNELKQFVKHHQHSMVRLGSGDLKKPTVRRERQQPALLTGYCTPMLEVSFIPHNDDLSCTGQFLLGLSYALHLLPHHIEAGSVTDAVNKDIAICPLQLSVTDVSWFLAILKQNIYALLIFTSQHAFQLLHIKFTSSYTVLVLISSMLPTVPRSIYF